MPQVDLMSSYTGGASSYLNDRNIACETHADDDSPVSNQPDLPPESFFLSKVAELDWIDCNAFIDRSVNSNQNFPAPDDPVSDSGSLSVKSKQSIIGLPEPEPDQAAYKEAKHRRPARIRLFPKRSSSSNISGRKSAVPTAEPSSPKVSCMGRVRSRRDRNRRRNTGRRKQAEPAITRSRSNKIQKKRGFWSSFRSIFQSRGRKQPKGSEIVSQPPEADPPPLAAMKRFSSARRSDAWAADLEDDAPKSERPPTLGAVKRFSSGRRSDARAADLALAVHVVKSEPSDPPTGEVGPTSA